MTSEESERVPRCPTCDRAFANLFDVPRVTVLGVDDLNPKAEECAKDWMAQGHRTHEPAKSLPALLLTPAIVEYVGTLRGLVGRTVRPVALRPQWSGDSRWPSIQPVPGAPEKPSAEWTFWTLTFATTWQAQLPEGSLTVSAAIGGHSLGRQFGSVSINVAPIIRVRVSVHLEGPAVASQAAIK